MRQKWPVILLVVFGILAAVSAAVLAASLRFKPVAVVTHLAPPDLTILVAAKDISAMSSLDAGSIVQKTVLQSEAPDGYYVDPAAVVGKVTAVPLVKDQALTPNVFCREGAGAYVAALLPPGMRAVSVSLNDSSALEGLLYPGSKVDVLATFKITGEKEVGEAVATALLENIEVLAVNQLTVGAPQEEVPEIGGKEEDAPLGPKVGNQTTLVSLAVNDQQAEAVELGKEHGVISLALRNPKDAKVGFTEATVLSGGRLGQLAKLLDPGSDSIFARKPPEPKPAPEEPPKARSAPEPEPEVSQVQVEVIRCTDSEMVSFPYPNAKK